MSRFPLLSGRALVTGASSGIGAAFGRALAVRGNDLILVARREERLRALAEEWTRAYGVRVEILAADLASDEGIARVEERLRSGGDVDLLINNAGFGAGGAYSRIDMAGQLRMIKVHVEAAARLIREALPSMIEKGRGAVINVASVAAFSVTPKSAMYAATKAWMVSFSRSLAGEVRHKGVLIQALCPGFTFTEFHDVLPDGKFDRSSIPRFMWMDADKVVAASLRGLRKGRIVVIPGFRNRIMTRFAGTRLAAAVTSRFGRRT